MSLWIIFYECILLNLKLARFLFYSVINECWLNSIV